MSVRRLQAPDYSPDQIEGAVGTVFGVDSQLIADETYFVAQAVRGGNPPIIVGCGGWSNRKTLFGSDHGPGRESSLLDPLHDSARIRAFFVHPDWARRGIGTLILETCENAAMEAGFRDFELGATCPDSPAGTRTRRSSVDSMTAPSAGFVGCHCEANDVTLRHGSGQATQPRCE